jgi:hypothetical protein
MTNDFYTADAFMEAVLDTATTVHRCLKGSRNDVALSALLVTVGAALERFGAMQPETTPPNILMLLALIREVVSDIAAYAIDSQTRES